MDKEHADKCQKQKLTVQSYAEGQIVGFSNVLPNMIWIHMFLKEQGYELAENILQGNGSSTKNFKDGNRSSGQKKAHGQPVFLDNGSFEV